MNPAAASPGAPRQSAGGAGGGAIGILGGSFAPVHRGHVALALAARAALGLDQVRLMPAAQPWQKGRLAASA
ncbi:MAG: nicotinic acid mononucleotide adenylyltransferase, partial [Betaproteobacteria bacterium]